MNVLIVLKSRLLEDVVDEMWKKMLSLSLMLGFDFEDMLIELEYYCYFFEWVIWFELVLFEDGFFDISSNFF